MSGKPIQPELIQDRNCLTAQNGCSVIYSSSEDPRGTASNILQPIQNKIWLTLDNIPQECIISLKNMNKCPSRCNVIGFYSWHQLDTNPALIQSYIRAQKSQQWHLVAKIRLALTQGWQFFKIQQLNCQQLSQLKICITQNYGGDKTYLNQIALHYINFATLIPTVRESRSSTVQEKIAGVDLIKHNNHLKASTNKQWNMQKQLIKANDKIVRLTQEHQKMKSTILHQGEIIIKLQTKIKTILQQMQKIYSMQQKLMQDKVTKKKGIQDQDDSLEEIQDYQQLVPHKQQNTKKMNPKKLNRMLQMIDDTVASSSNPPKISNYTKYKQQHKTNPNRHQQVIRITSQQNFSEYSPTKYQNLYATHEVHNMRNNEPSMNHSRTNMRGSRNKQELINKIKLLLQLKQQKKTELSSKKSRDNRDRWSAHQSHSGKSQKYTPKGSLNRGDNVWEEESDDDQYFKKVRHRKAKVNCY